MKLTFTFIKNKKKLERYFKNNRIRRKTVIDIPRIIKEEKLDINNLTDLFFLKALIFKDIAIAFSKNKHIFYIPLIYSNFDILRLSNLKEQLGLSELNILVFKTDLHKNYFTQIELYKNIFNSYVVIEGKY